MRDESLWKRRFRTFAAIRLVGVATLFLGIAIAYTGLIRPGGWPAGGAIMVITGLIVAMVAPRILKRQWEREDAK